MKISAVLLRLALAAFSVPLVATAADGEFAVSVSGNTSGALVPTDAALAGAAYLDTSLPVEKRVADLLPRLTAIEKASLLHGAGGYADFGGIPRIGLGKITMTDGPQGVRTNIPVTALPSGIAMAATWDPELVALGGAAMGRDAKATGYSVLLGPGVNIARTPFGARNFEYFGEDPVLSGMTAAGYIRGVQSEKVAACIKHLALNDQELARLSLSVEADERTIRETHLRPFEIAVREAGPWSVMPAYNKVRGVYCAENGHLNNDLLREAIGFDGAFISDWGAWHDDARSLTNGCTIRMPHGADAKYDERLAALVTDGKVAPAVFDEAVRRNLRLLFRTGAFDRKPAATARFLPENVVAARRLATESAVLLKNNDNLLPLDAVVAKRVLIVGPGAARRTTMEKGGDELLRKGGSGATFPAYEYTALDGFRERLGAGTTTFPWIVEGDRIDRDGLARAAREADAVVFVGGLSFDEEHEGNSGKHPDRIDFAPPGPQAEAVRVLREANPRTVVVLRGGSAFDVEGIEAASPAILMQWYPGQEGGRALADLVFGDANPSGKLPVTFGKKLADWRTHRTAETYPGIVLGKDGKPLEKQPDPVKVGQHEGADRRVYYKEGVAVGYRGFEADGIAPRFAFGRGLSYTTFGYASPAVTPDAKKPLVTLRLSNTGKRAGAEVVQIYARPPASVAWLPESERPLRGLVGFSKVFLKTGETREVSIPVNTDELRTWSEKENQWKTAPGEWTFEVASASDDVRLKVPYVIH